MKASSDFFDYSILSVTGQDANFPVGNLKIYDSSTISWHSASISANYIIIDLFNPVSEPVILVYRPNFTAIRFYGNSVNEWGGEIPFDSGDEAITQDPDHFIYKLGIKLTGFNYRYLRVEIPSQATLDGMAYFEMGVLAIFTTLEDFSGKGAGFGLPVDMKQIMNEVVNRSETNRKSIIPISDIPVLELNLSGNIQGTETNRNRMKTVFGNPTKSLFYIDRTIVSPYKVYLAQRNGGMSISEVMPGNNGAIRYSIALETIL